MLPSEPTTSESRLCTACGLCCDGVLFHIVRLQPEDSVKSLEALGVKLSRKKSEPYFKQPCTLLHACTCTQYASRPARCRAFECRQLKGMANGELTETEALRNIEDAKVRVAQIEALLCEAGNAAVHLPLADRYAQVLSSEIGVPDPAHRLLAHRMAELEWVLNENFRDVPSKFDSLRN